MVNKALSLKERYYLICQLLTSKNYCHYIINNKKILSNISEIFYKFKPLFKYIIAYTWTMFYKEENIKKKNTTIHDRFVIDIDTANKLPVFPFSCETPYLNPYFCLPVSSDLLCNSKNIFGVQGSINEYLGIVDLNDFEKRLRIFISGDENINIFD